MVKIVEQTMTKGQFTQQRIADAFRLFPQRAKRLWQHISHSQSAREKHLWGRVLPIAKSRKWRYFETVVLLCACFGLAEWYEITMLWCKRKTRPLTDEESKIAQLIFGDTLPLHRIRIDETARIATKKYRICYVSFYTINSWGAMRPDTFIHELIHIWQYEQIGALYIPKALWAQQHGGYDYGGVEALKKHIQQEKDFWEFNLEQQGDIIADYFRLSCGLPVRWGQAQKGDIGVYMHVVKHVLEV